MMRRPLSVTRTWTSPHSLVATGPSHGHEGKCGHFLKTARRMTMFMVVSGRRDTARSGTDGSMYRAMKRRVRRSEPKTRRSRGRDDRGAVLIEAAFLLPFLFALLFGIIDFGFVFNDWISVRQGGRDGLREVIVNTNPTGPGAGGSWSCNLAGGPFSAEQTSRAWYIKSRLGLDDTKPAVAVFFMHGSFVGGQPVKVCV